MLATQGTAGTLLELEIPNTTANLMKTKQLANVLIKILGLSVCVNGIPTIIQGLLYVLAQDRGIGSPGGNWVYAFFPYVFLPAIGIYLMVKSQDVTEYLFKSEIE